MVHDPVQIDRIAILDSTGEKVVEYHYDAWGRPVGDVWKKNSSYNTLAALNPFRYRGYIWDEETGLYYLKSRYYNPEWCRLST